MATRSLRLHGIGALVTGQGRERGPVARWHEVGWLPQGEVVVQRDAKSPSSWTTQWVGSAQAPDRPAADADLDLGGRLLVPGLVDAHTHAVFAGDRSGEFTRRMAGESYQQIAAGGGGIVHTVRQTRAAGVDDLAAAAAVRLEEMAAWGAVVVEIKTGYGLDVQSECRLLDAIALLEQRFAGRVIVVPTAMPAHAVPPEWKHDTDGYVSDVCVKILPALAKRPLPPAFCDIFIERGYFDLAQAERVRRAAVRLGMRLKAHVDEFADLGGVAWAVDHGAVSVEHLLCTHAAGIAKLAASDTVAVGLPLTSLYLREPFAPLRPLVDAGALVALGTDCNPGSAMTTNLPFALQMAVLGCKLSPPEALRAATVGGSKALAHPGGFTGRIEAGKPFLASLFACDGPDRLFYELAAPPRASSEWLPA